MDGRVLDIAAGGSCVLAGPAAAAKSNSSRAVTSSPAPSSPGDMAARPGAMVKRSSLLFDLRIRGSHLRAPSPAAPESSASQCSQNAIRTAFFRGQNEKDRQEKLSHFKPDPARRAAAANWNLSRAVTNSPAPSSPGDMSAQPGAMVKIGAPSFYRRKIGAFRLIDTLKA